jgi:hypothetical protein
VFDPTRQNALAPGQMQTMNAPQNALAMPVRPERPQFDMATLQGAMGSMQHGDLGQMFNNGGIGSLPQPLQDAYGQFHDYRHAMQQYRGDMRDYRQQMHGQGPMMTPGGGGGGGPLQGGPNTQFPLNPAASGFAAPGVGSQMGVIGATPAGSPFGLPSY